MERTQSEISRHFTDGPGLNLDSLYNLRQCLGAVHPIPDGPWKGSRGSERRVLTSSYAGNPKESGSSTKLDSDSVCPYLAKLRQSSMAMLEIHEENETYMRRTVCISQYLYLLSS